MRKVIFPFLFMLLTMFSIPAFAAEPAEKVAYRGLSIGIYDVWVHSDGRLQITESQTANWGESFTREPEYLLPQSHDYELTRVEIKNQNNKFSEAEFNKFNDKGYVYNSIDEDKSFKAKYLKQLKGKYIFKDQTITLTPGQKKIKLKINGKLPNNLVELTSDTTDIMDNEKRAWYGLPVPYNPSGITYGGRFHGLATITIFGIPKAEAVTDLPDLYVREIKTTAKETAGGKVYNATVIYGMKGPFDGKVTAKLGLTHNGYGISKIDGQKAEFSAWQEKTFNFTFTGQKGKDSVLEGKIWPVSPTSEDSNWSNNNKKLVVPQKATDDLAVVIGDWPSSIEVGKSVNAISYVRNYGNKPITTKVVWRINGSRNKTQTITVNPGLPMTKTTLKISVPSGTKSGTRYQLNCEVNPDRNKPSEEKTWVNNKVNSSFRAFAEKKSSPELTPGRTLE